VHELDPVARIREEPDLDEHPRFRLLLSEGDLEVERLRFGLKVDQRLERTVLERPSRGPEGEERGRAVRDERDEPPRQLRRPVGSSLEKQREDQSRFHAYL
jgi:hypothetical protein